MCSTSIKNEINALSSIVSEISILLSPILYSANNIQKREDIDGLTTEITSDQGFWKACLYVNGRTELLHTEELCLHIYKISKEDKKMEY